MRNKFDTFYLTNKKINKKWLLVDVENKTLGRVASAISAILIGKNKSDFQPNMDNGDYVVVINAEKIKITGNKYSDKVYHKYSGYPGGISSTFFKDMLDKHPERILELAVKRMLPKGRMGRSLYRNLHIYKGSQHSNIAQKPIQFEIS
jgi:large subunit ribosomal protein L13